MNGYSKKLITLKLDDNFHESLFFLEIQYEKTPTKKIKDKLTDYYMKAIDYYSSKHSKKDFSLYFQSKLLSLLKGEDYFEKVTKAAENENIIEEEKKELNYLLTKEKKLHQDSKRIIQNDLNKQSKDFLLKLTSKLKNRHKRSRKFRASFSSEIAPMNFLKSLNDGEKNFMRKKNSIDLTAHFQDVNNKNDYFNKKNKEGNVLNKIDNIVNDFERVNTIIIIDYVKKLKKLIKLKNESVNNLNDQFLNYSQANNELNLLYEGIEDKDSEEGIGIKKQIDQNEEDWKKANKKYLDENEEIKNKYINKKYSKEKENSEIKESVENILKKIKDLMIKVNDSV